MVPLKYYMMYSQMFANESYTHAHNEVLIKLILNWRVTSLQVTTWLSSSTHKCLSMSHILVLVLTIRCEQHC